jgi:hypothetical protein
MEKSKRRNFIGEQLEFLQENPNTTALEIVQSFRLHFPNTASFASSISRFKSLVRKQPEGVEDVFLIELKPTAEETASVREKNRTRLQEKCQNSITLKDSGDNLIMYFRNCLESTELGKLIMGIQACSGLRMVEAVCRGRLLPPKLPHASTDDTYWGWVQGVVKKQGNFPGHERPLLHRREIIESALRRLRSTHFPALQKGECDNTEVSRKACKKVNRAINKSWPFPDVARVTSHFFRSFYVSATFHYFNNSSSLAQWCSDVLAHESLDASFPYTGLLVTGFGSLTFDSERHLQGMARLKL